MVTKATATIQPGSYQGFLDANYPTIAEELKQAGYNTYMTGKWHVGERKEHWPLKRGFEHYFGLISGASSYYEIIPEEKGKSLACRTRALSPTLERAGGTQPGRLDDHLRLLGREGSSPGRRSPRACA